MKTESFVVSLRDSWRRALGLALFAACLAGAHAQTASKPPPAEHFFENSAFSGAQLSPNGRYLAVRMSKPGRRTFLAVIELETKNARALAEYTDADIGTIQWVNDERIVFDTMDLAQASGNRRDAPGLFAINRDGSKFMQLADRSWRGQAPLGWNTFLLDQIGAQDSDSIYVTQPRRDSFGKSFGFRLLKVDTFTGDSTFVTPPEDKVNGFVLDAKGKPRLALWSDTSTTVIHYRDPASGVWRKVAGFDNFKDGKNAISPLGFAPDGTLYVVTNGGEDMATLRTFDIASGTVSKEPLVATPGYDFSGSLVSNDKLLGVRLTTDAEANIWFDPAMKAIQAAVDKALPGTVNMLDVPARPDAPWLLVKSYSDRQPSRYLVYHIKTGLLELVGSTYANIEPARMGRQEPIRYKARDGLEIPGLLTLPPGGVRKNLPMVVLVHGGPWVRGASWGWDPETQFLASRGYAVLQVEFRGSTGFGLHHYQAGMKQWGLAMQNDIADGTRWAIAQGIADPKRICIAGASYGGYATLMGLINDPELYRCGVDWVGVTDIELMHNGTWYSKPNFSTDYVSNGMPLMVGDLDKDAAQLQATSPIQQAARIRQPLLLAYGQVDRRVPLHQGKLFYEAVRRTNKQVEWVVYDDEGHGWSLPKNRIDFWQRVERFLDKHIGQPPAAAPAPQ